MPDSQSLSEASPADPSVPQESSKAILAMVLAILSFFTCGFLMSIPAVLLANAEIEAIGKGRRPAQNLGIARGAYWVGMANTALTLVAVLAALLVPTILGQMERARASRASEDTRQLMRQIERIPNDTGSKSP